MVATKKDYLYVYLIVFISTLFRFILSLSSHIFDKNYWFLDGSSPYFLKGDSYYYFGVLRGCGLSNILIYVAPYVFTLFSLVLFYALLRRLKVNDTVSLLGTICLSFFPNFYSQTLLGYVDSPHVIMFFIILGLHFYLSAFNDIKIQSYKRGVLFVLLLISIFFLLSIFWSGFPIITLIFTVGFFFHIAKSWKYYAFFVIFSIAMLFRFYTRFEKLLMYKGLGVGEYLTSRFILYYLMVIIIIFCYFYIIDKDNMKRFFLGSMFFCFFFSLFIGRFGAFTIIFVMILFCMFMNQVRNPFKFGVFLILLIFCFSELVVISPNVKPLMSRPYEGLLYEMDKNLTVITFWDNGHMINSITDRKTKFFGSPRNITVTNFILGISLAESDGVLYLDKMGGKSRYYFVLHSQDKLKAEYLTKQNITNKDSIMIKSLKNQPLNHFSLIGKAKYDNNTYWIYIREYNNNFK